MKIKTRKKTRVAFFIYDDEYNIYKKRAKNYGLFVGDKIANLIYANNLMNNKGENNE